VKHQYALPVHFLSATHDRATKVTIVTTGSTMQFPAKVAARRSSRIGTVGVPSAVAKEERTGKPKVASFSAWHIHLPWYGKYIIPAFILKVGIRWLLADHVTE